MNVPAKLSKAENHIIDAKTWHRLRDDPYHKHHARAQLKASLRAAKKLLEEALTEED